MLDFVRTHQRWMQMILFIFIVPSFVFFGVESYSRFLDQPDDLAKVAKETVTISAFKDAFKEFSEQEKANLEAANADDIDAKINTPQNKQLVLDQIIHSMVSKQEALRLAVQTSDDKVLKSLAAMPFVAGFKDANGKIDTEKLNQAIAAQGMTPEQFQERMRYLITLEYLPQNISQSSFLPQNIVDALAAKLSQKRWVQAINFNQENYLAQARNNMQAEQLQAYFEKNKKQFLAAEQVNIEYITLDKTKLVAPAGDISIEKAREYFQKNSTEFKLAEQRQAAHILFKAEKPEEKPAQKLKAQAMLDNFIKTKISLDAFKAAATKNSDDPGSKTNGGDLGLFARGAMVKPFEDAAFGAKTTGLIPQLIESDFGFHIIYLSNIQAGKTPAFEEVQSDIIQKLTQNAQTELFNQQLKLVDAGILDNLDMSKLAQKINVPVQNAEHIYKSLIKPPQSPEKLQALMQKTQNLPEFLKTPKVLQALFAEDVAKGRRHTDILQVGEIAIVAHVKQHIKEKALSFEEAKPDVEAAFIAREAIKLARTAGLSKLASAKLGETQAWSTEQEISRMLGGIPKEMSEAIFNTDSQKLPSYSGVNTPKGYVLFKINKVEDAPAGNEVKDMIKNFSAVYSLEESRAMLDDLKQNHHVRMIKPLSEVK